MGIAKRVLMTVQHFNKEKYWKMRDYIQNYSYTRRVNLKLLWYVFRVKKMKAFANASTGIKIGPRSATMVSCIRFCSCTGEGNVGERSECARYMRVRLIGAMLRCCLIHLRMLFFCQ